MMYDYQRKYENPKENKGLQCPTPHTGAVENIGDFPGLSNRSGPPGTNENPGALAGATGAGIRTLGKSVSEMYRDRMQAASDLCAAISKCHHQDAHEIMSAALSDLRAGWPIAPLLDLAQESAFWADMATIGELRAYAMACFTRLPLAEQRAFLRFATGRAV